MINKDLDSEGNWIAYMYIVLFACMFSFIFLEQAKLLNISTFSFWCVFYTILIFHGCKTSSANQQKQAPLEENQLTSTQKDSTENSQEVELSQLSQS